MWCRKSAKRQIFESILSLTPGGGSCNIYSTGHFAMKYARVYGGDNNDLTLTFNSLSPPQKIYAPKQGGSLIINRLNVEYSGVNPSIIVYSDTKNVILNCGDSPWCIKNTDIDLSQILGYFHVTATAITDRNIYLPSNPTTPSSINCNGDAFDRFQTAPRGIHDPDEGGQST